MRLAGDFSCAYRELMLKSEIAMGSITTLELPKLPLHSPRDSISRYMN